IRARAGGERQPTPPQYAEFSYTYSHLLGLGPGAYSHLYGFAWYREVTALAEVPCTPQYYGTPLTHLDECRQEILSDLGRRRGVDLDELANRTGVDLRGRLANQFADIPELAVRGSRLRLQRDISDERETEIRKFLLPERAAVVDVDQAQASTPDHRVESELIVRPLAARYDEVALLAKFCLQMQIEKVGLRTLGARLRARDDRSLVFEVEPKPAPTLWIHIRKPGIVRGFARSGAFEITYQSRSDAPLTGAEKEFLDQLAQRMQALDDT
ncbi:MAG: hypothetical protein ACPG77_18515, partial [Nannocystaceae bacterium]